MRAKRAGAKNIKVADINQFYENLPEPKFDKIVVDAPCTGTGTFGRRPDLKWRLEEDSFEEYHKKQLEILEKVSGYLKVGGKLIYMTCSIEKLENEDVVETFLGTNPEFKKTNIDHEDAYELYFWPEQVKSDGFYMAVMEKYQ